MGRKTITVSEETYDALDESRPDGVTWDTWLKGISGHAGIPVNITQAEAEKIAGAAYPIEKVMSRLNELERQLPDAVADELMGRMR